MNDHPTPLGGSCSARFDPLRELFAAKLESGEDLGASLAVNIDGEMVVDLWGGWADEARTAPWTENTIANVFSTTKTMTALTLDDLYDWDNSTALLAAQAPWWEPGTASGYHAMTYGHLISEVIRRITDLRLGEFFAAHVAAPLGADFHIGLPPSEFHRVTKVVPPPLPVDAPPVDAPAFDPKQIDPTSVAFKTWTNPTMPGPDYHWTEGWRRADIGAANGHGNARSLARLQSAVACGGEVDGVQLLSPQTIDRIFETQSDGIDLVIGAPLQFGIGYALHPGQVCAWGGTGGSTVIIDAERRITFAYVMNRMAPAAVIAPALAERLKGIVNR